MKKFSVNCDFGGQMAPFTIYIGQPEPGHHPLHFQADWLSKQRGGTIPAEVMDAVTKLQELANKNNVLVEELCVYALGSAQESVNEEAKQKAEQDASEETAED
ncbi:DUF2610 domain-containing protein [Candidatus Tisiphia endosymbiont of Nemotelus uliginosus]|uniref:DUF2610 domain-containing protein n=1 Tax=Candidatus Tisiphia endosymbiont of Nemotelus uliginosus TaxID=3077926 RepID=UPI0035C91D89